MLYVDISVCVEILYGSLMTVGLLSATTTTDAADDKADDKSGESVGHVVLRRHPGFTADSIGYNAETGQSVNLITVYLLGSYYCIHSSQQPLSCPSPHLTLWSLVCRR